MSVNPVDDARKWAIQNISPTQRVGAFLSRCLRGGFKPESVELSSDLFNGMVLAAGKVLKKEFCENNYPTALRISIGNHNFKVVENKEMPKGSLHAGKGGVSKGAE